MILWNSIVSMFNEKGTLLKFLKQVLKALEDDTLKDITVKQPTETTAVFTFNFEGGTSIEAPEITLPRGEPGEQGIDGTPGRDGANSIVIGTTTTLTPGSPATVENVGTPTDQIYNFGIPAGRDGTNGRDGTDGTPGRDGTNGADGLSIFNASGIIETTTTKILKSRVTVPAGHSVGVGSVIIGANNGRLYITGETSTEYIGTYQGGVTPIASSSTAGLVKPEEKGPGETQPVTVDENGKLFTKPGGSGGGSVDVSIFNASGIIETTTKEIAKTRVTVPAGRTVKVGDVIIATNNGRLLVNAIGDTTYNGTYQGGVTPIASSSTAGLVKPEEKGPGETQPVTVDENGKLFTGLPPTMTNNQLGIAKTGATFDANKHLINTIVVNSQGVLAMRGLWRHELKSTTNTYIKIVTAFQNPEPWKERINLLDKQLYRVFVDTDGKQYPIIDAVYNQSANAYTIKIYESGQVTEKPVKAVSTSSIPFYN